MRLSELLCTFAVAADAAMGMPMDHGLRTASVAVRLGELAKARDGELVDAFYLALLRYVGCTSDADLAAEVMGDEVSVRSELYGVDWGSARELVPRLARAVARGKSGLHAAASVARTFAKMPKLLDSALSHCEVGDRLAERVGFGEPFRAALFQTFERWDGRGWPRRVKQDAIALPMRLAHAAEEIEIAHRAGGIDGAVASAKARAGKTLDPRLVEDFRKSAARICAPLEQASPWRAALDAEPSPQRALGDVEIDEVLLAMADFTDLKSRYTRTHSRGVARIARDAARQLRLGVDAERSLQRAAWLHDLGRVGVSTAIWDKQEALTDGERERIRLHSYLGERILAPAMALAQVAEIASLAHERIDGSGYHRRLAGAACPLAARIIAAADVYHALTENRPQRAAVGADQAAQELRASARAGALCSDAVAAVLAGAGQARPHPERPGGLTEREHEVLRLVARGCTNKEIAVALGISARTAGHHLEHIFEKLGVTTRAAATMFAMQKGLVG